MKHTLGPWHAERTPASAYFDWTVMAPSGKGRVMQIGIDTDNPEADARLIAAAPELLEHLIAISSYADAPHVDPIKALSFIRETARAAIAKAEGKQ